MRVHGSRASWIVRLARRVWGAVDEMNYANRRVVELMLSRAAAESDEAPDTYAEFLLRASAASLHEPPARCR
jgi:hypothetical protein